MKMVKKITALVIMLALLVNDYSIVVRADENDQTQDINKVQIWSGNGAMGFADGTGEFTDPYIISNGEQLRYFADRVSEGDTFYNKFITLSDDIYLNDVTDYSQWSDSVQPNNIWNPIGGSFAGTFDGEGHSIIGLYIFDEKKQSGFFRETNRYNAPTIKNISFENAYVSGKECTGIVVGHAIYLNCENVVVDGIVHGSQMVGGIVGGYYGLTSPDLVAGSINLINCINYAEVTATECHVGGLVGYASNNNLPNNDKIVIDGCRNVGNISGQSNVGGLCGYLLSATDSQGASIENSKNSGKIIADNMAGGLFGYIESNQKEIQVQAVCNVGDVTVQEQYAGGIAGAMCSMWITSTMSNLYNIGNISANFAAGGLAGRGSTGTLGYFNIYNFYNLGEISASSKAYAGISDSYIVGWYGNEKISVNNAYYDKKYSFNDSGIVTNNAVALEPEQFKNVSSFNEFDFVDVWTMTGYGPAFLWEQSDHKCGENAFWTISGDVNNLTLYISGYGDTFDYDGVQNTPWIYNYKIKNVIIDDEITSIGSYLFAYDKNIKSIRIGNKVEEIHENAFLGCENIEEIIIPSNVKCIGNWCFMQSGLKQIEFEGDAPQLFNGVFYGLTLEVKYNSEMEGWENVKNKSYGGNITWTDLARTINTNYIKYTNALFNKDLPEIPSDNEEQYVDELYSWVVEYGYEDILTKDKCEEIIKKKMISLVGQDDSGTYVTYKYSTLEIMRDILMINSTKKSLLKWEKNDIKHAEVKELDDVYADVDKIINQYNTYEQNNHRAALSIVFFSLYAKNLLKKSIKKVFSISSNYLDEEFNNDFNDDNFEVLYNELFVPKFSLSNLSIQCAEVSKEILEKIKEDFPKKFTKKICKTFFEKIVEQNKDIYSFKKVYDELSSYVGSFRGDSIMAQFGAQSILPLQLLKIYVDLMKEIDDINQSKYFMLQYSLMRYYPDLYDKIIDEKGNVIDIVDYYLLDIDSAFLREQLDNWYNKGGATVHLSEKQRITLMNTASLIVRIQDSDPLSMKQKLVEYWYEYETNDLVPKQSELIMNADVEFSIKDEAGNLVGQYKDNKFTNENSRSHLRKTSSLEEPSENTSDSSQVLYEDDNILVELGVTKSYVHILFVQGTYACSIDKPVGEVYLTDTAEDVSQSYKYSNLDPHVVVEINEQNSRIVKDGQIVPDDSKKQSDSGIDSSSGTNVGEISNEDMGKKEGEESDTKKPSNENQNESNNNKILKIGDTDETGMYRATSKTTAIFSPSRSLKIKKLVIEDFVTIDGVDLKVTKIDQNALKNNRTIENVIIGKNVTVIGKSAFDGARNLRAVRFRGRLIKKINDNAFRNAKKLQVFDLSKQNKLKFIGKNCFKNCKSLKQLKINIRQLERIGKHAFETGSEKLKCVVFGKKKAKYDVIINQIKKSGAKVIKFR